ncbi:retron Se72 family effector protein [Endozoicomonas euniceicola]|uniref:Retron Se72 family effector protein n=1 Tax=Endozoicomonas euniceicola TaxID=1234143 RepID=A0ABY6GR23_9GAMM|nr:retron Se72 family effector protein [Endozoicomonas euniceicola]UYM15202.1 retron Se72 family effector protein [Endozoicomonas euniceicola]
MTNDRGYINTYDPIKGFGFIRREKGKDVFFHYSELKTDEGKIGVGDYVTFSTEKSGKGLRAKEVVKES